MSQKAPTKAGGNNRSVESSAFHHHPRIRSCEGRPLWTLPQLRFLRSNSNADRENADLLLEYHLENRTTDRTKRDIHITGGFLASHANAAGIVNPT
jgi:hypothetical protein